MLCLNLFLSARITRLRRFSMNHEPAKYVDMAAQNAPRVMVAMYSPDKSAIYCLAYWRNSLIPPAKA